MTQNSSIYSKTAQSPSSPTSPGMYLNSIRVYQPTVTVGGPIAHGKSFSQHSCEHLIRRSDNDMLQTLVCHRVTAVVIVLAEGGAQ